MKKILFCIYIITACTYLRPVIAGTCKPVIFEKESDLPITNSYDALLPFNGIREGSSILISRASLFTNKEVYVCGSYLFGQTNNKYCDNNSLVYVTYDEYGAKDIFKCDSMLSPSWKQLDYRTLPICKKTLPANTTNAKFDWTDTTVDREKIKHSKLTAPCLYYYCPAHLPIYDKKYNECTDLIRGDEKDDVNCSDHGFKNAKKCGRYRSIRDGSTTYYIKECDVGYKPGEVVRPNDIIWMDKYRNCIKDTTNTGGTEIAAATTTYTAAATTTSTTDTAAATTTSTTDTAAATTTTTTDTATATTTTTATASEPRDEYADIIKKIEDEISEYSKKCSKYTKDKSSS